MEMGWDVLLRAWFREREGMVNEVYEVCVCMNTSFALEGPECSQSVCAWHVRDHQLLGLGL